MAPEEVELLSELTIVIPTYNRPLELERAIEYWRDIPVTVHILDGSDNPQFQVGALPGTFHINYNHLPQISPDGSAVRSYIRRMRHAANLPTTQFSALCGDDDAFVVSGLVEMLRRLKTDVSVDALIGRCAMYKRQNNLLLWKLAFHDLRNSPDYLSDSVARRLRNWNKAPFAFYGVVRTELWKKMLKLSFEYELGAMNFTPGKMLTFEMLMRTVDKALCRIGVLDKVIWLRQAPNYYKSATKRGPNGQVLKEWFNAKKRRDHQIARKQIVKAILFKDPKFGRLRAYRLAAQLAKRKFERQVFLEIAKTKLIKVVNFLLFFLSTDFKYKINHALPSRVSSFFGFFETTPERQNATAWSDLTAFLNKLRETDIAVDGSELQHYECLLSKPREELRLRANI